MKYVWGSATHQGMVRQNNEDSLFPEKSGESEGPAVLMVADGMGGHAAGEVASKVAVEAINEFVCMTGGDEEITVDARVVGVGAALVAILLRAHIIVAMVIAAIVTAGLRAIA